MLSQSKVESAYKEAKQRYAQLGVNTDKVLRTLENVSLSLPCWQGDDLKGFEIRNSDLVASGLQVTGSYPGRARTIDELRQDLEKACSLIPGRHRLNLHAIYGDFKNQFVDRDEISSEHFRSWVDWAEEKGLKLDFNATCFSHPQADSGFTLSHKDKNIRDFWVEHVKCCRAISTFLGRKLHSPCIHNLWIPDGMKDIPVDRWTHRALLKEALNKIYEKTYNPKEMKDSVESKLFGLGSESFVVGSHEFYASYALSKKLMLCLDLGHFHPSESVADKISALLQFFDELLLHLSRGVRWDSDHVVIQNDEVRNVAEEIVRCNALNRVHIALDFFDASLNRVGAMIIGARATLKSLLIALLEPREKLREFEDAGNYFARLAFLEQLKTMPYSAVWDYYCLKLNVPPEGYWMDDVERYETEVTDKRS